jgi:hypothetical protein
MFLLADCTMAAARAPKLEGMKYEKARAVVLGYGWKPFPGPCGGAPVDEATCKAYPELRYCQGVSPGHCEMMFTRQGRCLFLTTLESPPGADDDTWITEVAFSRKPCPKEPG